MVIIAFLFAYSLFAVTKKKIIIKNKRTVGLLIIRSLFGLAGSITYLYAISNLNLADATLLNKTSPFFVVIFSFVFLKESVNFKLIIALILAAIGTAFVINPDMQYTLNAAIIGLLSGIFSGAAYVIIRCLKNDTNPETIAISFCVISIIASIPLMIFTSFVMPNIQDMLYIIGMAVCAAIAQYTLSIAFVAEKASKISIYTYAEVVFAAVIGIIVWREYIGVTTIIGALLISIGGLLNYSNNKAIDEG
jgi:drug/metabolite transporter (DMT)-like permease